MRVYNYLVLLLSFIIFTACKKSPGYPDTPSIEFKDIKKIYGSRQTLNLSIDVSFKDGNGDLGLSTNETTAPYQEFNYEMANGARVIIDNADNYDCKDILKPNGETNFFKIKRNLNHYNYFIEYFGKAKGSNNFIPLSYEKASCEKFDPVSNPNSFKSPNGRFPILHPDNYTGDLEGILNYTTILDEELRVYFTRTLYGTRKYEPYALKLKIYIQDRALNKSNIIETKEVIIEP
ncbi:MAG TPA: hypothetical protein VF691_02855 [Cytophagaceae bacterium]|jgi:hypothetical protein